MPRQCIFVYQEGQTWVLKHPQPGQNNLVTSSLAVAISRAKVIDSRAVVLVRHAKAAGKPAKPRSRM